MDDVDTHLIRGELDKISLDRLRRACDVCLDDDVEGLDAARKIVILASLAFGKSISPNAIHVEGITDIATEDVEIANKLGYSVKLIGHAEKIDNTILAMVSPRLIPHSNPLSGINDVFNGILLNADMVGQVMFYGPGAGKLPTASAVSADIVDIAAHIENGIKLPAFEIAGESDVADFEAYSCKRFFIFEKCAECNITLDCVKKCFGVDCSYSCFGC
jgi:homoserine dehydrogenase